MAKMPTLLASATPHTKTLPEQVPSLVQTATPPVAPTPAATANMAAHNAGTMSSAAAPALAGTAGATSAVTPAATPTGDDWQDQTYLDAVAALGKTMAGYQNQYNTSKATYDTDYNNSLKNLGWNQDTGGWNPDDNNTAYGRSFSNQQNDFAARDMLNSSFYGTALNDLLRNFTDQKSDIDTSKSKYETDLANTLQSQQDANDYAVQQAKAEAVARKAAGVASY